VHGSHVGCVLCDSHRPSRGGAAAGAEVVQHRLQRYGALPQLIGDGRRHLTRALQQQQSIQLILHVGRRRRQVLPVPPDAARHARLCRQTLSRSSSHLLGHHHHRRRQSGQPTALALRPLPGLQQLKLHRRKQYLPPQARKPPRSKRVGVVDHLACLVSEERRSSPQPPRRDPKRGHPEKYAFKKVRGRRGKD
jgi:hypothetical protein